MDQSGNFSIIEFLYGEGDAVRAIMNALMFFVLLDWLTGVCAARKDSANVGKYGMDGIFRTFFILLLPAGGHLLDQALGQSGVIFGALSVGTLYLILQSMTANGLRAGWGDYFPEWLIGPIMQWVKSELEAKIQRATGRSGGDNEGSKNG
ncbi:phage holin family protein [Paenibacillus lycopersici]|uniref:Phage holin family protein n=2 Tax=Paenibacillus lycopersici TaxID=2704462 RepID=A0A6C0G8U6_9BACL|nr:phage holin family protein [Paenibacillus lycopersici]